jgi:hypothetical protein
MMQQIQAISEFVKALQGQSSKSKTRVVPRTLLVFEFPSYSKGLRAELSEEQGPAAISMKHYLELTINALP